MIEIFVKDLVIEFPIFDNSHRSLKKKFINLTTGGRIGNDAGKHPTVRAIDEISLDIKCGERIGLLGHNGCGKTTLLRAMTGVYSPVSGQLICNGKIASLLDVSMGLDPDATGYENIYLKGVMDGMTLSNIKSRVNEIAEFTELGEYLTLPVRTYSSGMMLRLAFAIATSVDADIIIMDEWLSVGDASFSKKARARLDELINKASILVIASHDPTLIETICTRRIYMEHGQITKDEYLS